MLIPKKPVCITEKELAGYVFEEGEDTREAGERLAASYVNFYIEIKLSLCRSLETSMMFWQQIYCRSCSRSVRSCQSLQGDHHRRRQYPLHHARDTSTQMTDSRKSYKVSLQDRWKDKNAGFQNKQE